MTIRSLFGAALLMSLMTACQKEQAAPIEDVDGIGRKKVDLNAAPPVADVRHYILGFPEPFGPAVGTTRAQTVATYLSKVLGQPVEPRLFSYDQLADAVAAGAVDFAFMPAISYVKAARKGHPVLLRQAEHHGALAYRSAIFSKTTSGIATLEQARGNRLALVHSGSASGYVFPMHWLDLQHIDPRSYFSEQMTMADHSQVCQAVRAGRADVGASFTNANTLAGVVDGCRETLGDKISDLHIIAMTDPIPTDVMVVKEVLPRSSSRSSAELDRLMASSEGEPSCFATASRPTGFSESWIRRSIRCVKR